MTTRTTAADQTSDTTADKAAGRVVLWLELPRSGGQGPSAGTSSGTERGSWYGPAALYEEPERWDGMA